MHYSPCYLYIISLQHEYLQELQEEKLYCFLTLCYTAIYSMFDLFARGFETSLKEMGGGAGTLLFCAAIFEK